MVTKTFVIEGLNGEKDVDRINRALYEMWGINKVDVNMATKEATFSYDETAGSLHDFREALLEMGYEIKTEDGTQKESMHDWHVEEISRENVYTHDL